MVDLRAKRLAKTICRLDFKAGDDAHVEFDAGPTIMRRVGKPRRAWALVQVQVQVQVQAHSCYLCVEFVRDQTVDTRLGVHRLAYGWVVGSLVTSRS